MNVYTILFVALFTIFIAAIFYLLLKENVEVKKLRKNFTTMSVEDIKYLILKLSKDGIFINEDIFNKINTHFNLQNDELKYLLRQMNPDVNSSNSLITVGDFLIKAGSDLRSVLNTIFIGIGCLLSLSIPRSPYGVAKLYAYWITVNYREAYNMFACNGILFNHESPLRGETFVTRKITRATARIALGLEDCIYIGNLNAKRDWGHAKDYVEGMYLMLQQEKPEDFVLATGISTTIRDFIIMAFKELGVELAFKGEGDKEEGYVVANNGNYDIKVNQTVAKVDPKYFRPTEVDLLIGDATKAKTKLGWVLKYDLPALVKEMVASDLELFKKEKFLKENGYQIAKEGE